MTWPVDPIRAASPVRLLPVGLAPDTGKDPHSLARQPRRDLRPMPVEVPVTNARRRERAGFMSFTIAPGLKYPCYNSAASFLA